LELGVRSQEPGEKRKKEEGRSQKKCFYKYEMLPNCINPANTNNFRFSILDLRISIGIENLKWYNLLVNF